MLVSVIHICKTSHQNSILILPSANVHIDTLGTIITYIHRRGKSLLREQIHSGREMLFLVKCRYTYSDTLLIKLFIPKIAYSIKYHQINTKFEYLNTGQMSNRNVTWPANSMSSSLLYIYIYMC